MGFEAIECIGAASRSAVPADGVRVNSRATPKAGGRYIAVSIGAGLAEKLCLRGDETNLSLAFGSGRDAGKIGIAVDVGGGAFLARRQKKTGAWSLTINAATADGLFATDFPAFAVAEVEVVSQAGKPPMAVFAASAEMLEAE